MFKEANYYPLHALLAFNYKSKANTPPKFQRTKLLLVRLSLAVGFLTRWTKRLYLYLCLLETNSVYIYTFQIQLSNSLIRFSASSSRSLSPTINPDA